MAERVQIAEWYGHPYMDIDPIQRVRPAQHRVGTHTMKKAHVTRLAVLQEKAIGAQLTTRKQEQLVVLTALFDQQQRIPH